MGSGAIASMTMMREKRGKFRSLYHFCEEVNTRLINRRAIESLIKCGAFDSLKAKRSQLIAVLDEALGRASVRQRERARGQTSFLEVLEGARETDYLPDMEEWPENKLLAFEKEALGFYISGHPLAKFSRILEKYATTTTAELGELANGSEVTLGGIITTLRLITTRNGKRMAFAGLEDLKGRVEVVVFPDVYNKEASLVRKETMLIVKGRVDKSGEIAKIIASQTLPLEEAEELLTKVIHISMTTTGLEGEMLTPLKKILLAHPGEAKIYFHLRTIHHGEAVISLGPRIKAKATSELKRKIEELLGEGTIYYSA